MWPWETYTPGTTAGGGGEYGGAFWRLSTVTAGYRVSVGRRRSLAPRQEENEERLRYVRLSSEQVYYVYK